ncbi:MAG: ABC transporter ATP-binding protein [Lachnospiraceae bacterium]|nr:ABC transporter ATP-binding protein [Lachnospiraceae bacterium]
MKVLQVKGLRKYYGKEPNLIKALDNVDMSVENGEFLAIVGPSGSGKSTLLHMIGGIDTPTAGYVEIENRKLEGDSDALTIFRRKHIGFIFQDFNLIPVINVYHNIVLPLNLDGKEPEQDFLDEILSCLDLKDKVDRMPGSLSGGQQQRVAIARALVTKPSIILADEPTGNLDSETSEKVVRLLKHTSNKYQQTIIMITHNLDVAKKADRIIEIRDGRIMN